MLTYFHLSFSNSLIWPTHRGTTEGREKRSEGPCFSPFSLLFLLRAQRGHTTRGGGGPAAGKKKEAPFPSLSLSPWEKGEKRGLWILSLSLARSWEDDEGSAAHPSFRFFFFFLLLPGLSLSSPVLLHILVVPTSWRKRLSVVPFGFSEKLFSRRRSLFVVRFACFKVGATLRQ